MSLNAILFELKIILKSTNFLIAVLFNFVILGVFIVTNLISLQNVKEADIARFERARFDADAAVLMDKRIIERIKSYTDYLDEETISLLVEEIERSSEFKIEFKGYIDTILESLRAEDYETAFERHHLINKFFIEHYNFDEIERGLANSITPDKAGDEIGVGPGRNMADRYTNQYNFTSYLTENNIPPLYENDMKPFNFMYQLFQKWLPLYFFVIAAIVIYPVISKEIGNNSIVFTLSKPASRGKLLFAKYVSTVSSVVISVFGPIIIAAIVLGFVNGFDSPRYPVLHQKNSYVSFDPLYNNHSRNDLYYKDPLVARASVVEPAIIYPQTLASAYASMPGRIGISTYNFFAPNGFFINHRHDERLGFVSIIDFLLLTVPLFIVCALFFSAISFLLALIIKKEVFVLFFLLALSGYNMYVGQAKTDLSFTERLNPLLSSNAAHIISATGGITALGAICASLAATVIAYSISVILLRRLEIK